MCCAGEYGPLLAETSLREQFGLLQARFAAAPSEIKAALLSAYLKLKVAADTRGDEALATDIQAVFIRRACVLHSDLFACQINLRAFHTTCSAS